MAKRIIIRDSDGKLFGYMAEGSDTSKLPAGFTTELVDIPVKAATPAPVGTWEQRRDDKAARETLADLDTTLPRSVEDLLDVLVAKNTVKLDDFPQAMQDKVAAKRDARDKLMK